jgi:hypothetical protein
MKHHAKGYVRDDAYTNTVEGFYSIFKCGMKASINTAASSTCTNTRPGSTSVAATVRQMAQTILSAP